mmetsp:Transcript_924/g.2586  ORF Transcript_924/g.2586 Transcript_924/m.2586 type:complete len:1158 (-) Transcript_924:51-3524(-)
MGRFDTLAGMASASPPLVRLLDPSLTSGEADRAAVRSCREGTLPHNLDMLNSAIAASAARMVAGQLLTSADLRGDEQDLSKLVGLKAVAEMVMQHGCVLYHEAAERFVHRRHTFFSDLNAALDADGVDEDVRYQSPAWRTARAGNELLARLPLVRVPLNTFGSAGGSQQSLLLPIIPALSDAELLEHIELVKELREAREGAQQRGAPFDAAKYKLLIGALPPNVRAPVEFMIVKAAGEEAARELGISVSAADMRRFDNACADGGPLVREMREAEISLIADLSKRANVTQADIARVCSPRALLARYRRSVQRQHTLRDERLVTKQRFETNCPEVLDLLRAAVAANTEVSYKARGDTPIDALIVQKEELRGAGGQAARFRRFLNLALAKRGLGSFIKADSLVQRLASVAGIISAGVLHIKDAGKIGTMWCSKGTQVAKLGNYFYPALCRYLGCDQMKLLKPNSDHNTRMAGNHTQWTLVESRAMQWSHSTGGDHLSKIGCEAVLLHSVREGHCTGLPDNFELSDYIASYDPAKYFKPALPQKALAHMYVHLNKRSPESAWRDFADLSEFIVRFPHRFLTPVGRFMVPLLILTRDNAHGVSTLATRYCAIVFAKLHGLYYLNVISEEAGQSRRLAHEGVCGAASRGLTGLSFDLPINAPDQADEATTRWAEDDLQAQVVSKFPVTYKTGDAEDGLVSGEVPRSTLLVSGFVWLSSAQGAALLEAFQKGRASTFFSTAQLPAMEGFEYPGGLQAFFTECWTMLNTTGVMGCTKACEHQFEYKFNPSNPLCVPPEPELEEGLASFEDFLSLNTVEGKRASDWTKGDGFLAQPLPSKRRELKYCDLVERLERGGATAVDEWYPKLMLDDLLRRQPMLLRLFTDNHHSLPEMHRGKPLRGALCSLLCVTELALHAELAERVAKEEYKTLYEEMKTRQEEDGTIGYVSAIVERLIGKPADARHGWPNITHLKETIKALPGKVKIPTSAKRAVLIQLIALTWRDLPESERPRGRANTPAVPRAPPPRRQMEQELIKGADAPAVDASALAAAHAANDEVAAAIAATPSPLSDAVTDAEEAEEAEAEEATLRAEAEAAEALVETALAVVTDTCQICQRRVDVQRLRWDATRWSNVCKDDSACVPLADTGRKRARRQEGSYAQLAGKSK